MIGAQEGRRVVLRQVTGCAHRDRRRDGACAVTGRDPCGCVDSFTKYVPATIDTIYRGGRKWWVVTESGQRVELTKDGRSRGHYTGLVYVPTVGRGARQRWMTPEDLTP